MKAYSNIDMVWQPGHVPTAFLYDVKDGLLVHELELQDWGKEELLGKLTELYGFEAVRDPNTLFGTALKEIIHEDKVYQLYRDSTKAPEGYLEAVVEANSAQIVEIYSTDVNDMLTEFLGPGVSAWLSGKRINVLVGEHGANYAFSWPKQRSGRHEFGVWKEGEPNNLGASDAPAGTFGEGCVITRNGLFEDVRCDTVHAVVLSKPYISAKSPKSAMSSRDGVDIDDVGGIGGKLPPLPKSRRPTRVASDKKPKQSETEL